MHGIKKLITYCLVVGAMMAMAKISSAGPYAPPPGQPWGEFSFEGVNSFAEACIDCTPSDGGNSFFLDTPPWTFTGSGFLIVQDAFNVGDQFRVFDDAVALGDTSAPIGSDSCGSNPVDCFADPNASRGIFTLGAGDHSFTIQTLLSPFGGGAAYLCIDTGQGECGVPIGDRDVPEPMSMLLLGLGLVGAFAWVQRPQLSKIRVLIATKLQRR